MSHVCDLAFGTGRFAFMGCIYEIECSSGEHDDDTYLSSIIYIATLNNEEEDAKALMYNSINCLSYVLQTSLQLLWDQVDRLESFDVSKLPRQSIKCLDRPILTRLKKFDSLMQTQKNAEMISGLVNFFASGLHHEQSQHNQTLSFLNYYYILEKVSSKCFKDKITNAEAIDLVDRLFDKKVPLTSGKKSSYADDIVQLLNNRVKTDSYYKISYYLNKNKIKYDVDILAKIVKTRNDLAHGNTNLIEDNTLLAEIRQLAYEVIGSYLRKSN